MITCIYAMMEEVCHSNVQAWEPTCTSASVLLNTCMPVAGMQLHAVQPVGQSVVTSSSQSAVILRQSAVMSAGSRPGGDYLAAAVEWAE